MTQSTKRLLGLALTGALAISVFAGCTAKPASNNSTPGPTASTPSGGNVDLSKLEDNMKLTDAPAQEISLPITDSNVELSYFAMPEPYVVSKMKGYSDMTIFQEAEKLTGVKIKWREESYTDPKQKMNLMFSTGETEDIIWDAHIHAAGGPKKLLDEGLIMPLNKYIEHYAPNLKKLLAETPGLLEQISTDDGRIFMFPEIRLNQITRSNSGFAIRKDWLDKAKLPVPTTIEEWYTTLKTFQDMDINGNGKKDETFVSLGKNKTSQSITNFTVAYGIIDGFFIKDGIVKFGEYEPEYKSYLTEMAKWYKEGLLDPEFSTQDSKLFDSKMTNDTGAAYYGSLAGNLGKFISAKKDDPTYNLVPTPMPKAPDGKIYVAVNAYGKLVPHGAAVSTSNKNIIETVKWLDWHYSEAGHNLFNWGIEGQSYTEVDGKKQFTDLIMNNPDGLSMEEADAKFAGGVMVQMPIINDPDVFVQLKSLPQQKEASAMWSTADTSLILPALYFSEEETRTNANIMTEVNTYVSEQYNRYIMGVESLDTFDTFQQRLKDMGIEKVLLSYQESYDKYYKK